MWRKKTPPSANATAADFVVTLLKKRLFSSPRAFAHTVGVYLETVQTKAGKGGTPHDDEVPEWLEGFFEDTGAYDDEELA